MFVPTTIAFFWLCMFGGNAIYLELNAADGVGTAGIADLVRNWNLPSALYGTIDQISDVRFLQWTMSALATLLLATWFITSSDSGTLVITTMLSMGDDNPPQKFRIIWGMGEGFCRGGVTCRRRFSSLANRIHCGGFAVSIIMLLMTWGLFKSLATDPYIVARKQPVQSSVSGV